jgi:hypothetical protein
VTVRAATQAQKLRLGWHLAVDNRGRSS